MLGCHLKFLVNCEKPGTYRGHGNQTVSDYVSSGRLEEVKDNDKL